MAVSQEASKISAMERGSPAAGAEVLKPSEVAVETSLAKPEQTEAQEFSALDTQVDSELTRFEAEGQADTAGVQNSAADLGFSETEVNARLESTGARQALDHIKAGANSAYNSFKKVLAVGLGAGVLAGAQEVRPAVPYADKPAQTLASEQTRLPEKPEGAFQLTAEQIRQNLSTDKVERAYLSTENQDAYHQVSIGGHNTIKIDVPALSRLIPTGTKEATITHTHPLDLGVIAGYLPEEVENMRTGEMPLSHFPPSGADIWMERNLNRDLLKDHSGMKVNSQVIEPGGTWEFSVDPHNPATQTFDQAYGMIDEITDRFNAGLSSKDRKALASQGMDKIRPSDIEDLLEDKQTRKLGERYLATVRSRARVNPDWDKAVASIIDLEQVSGDLRLASKKGYSDKTRQHLIEMYTGLCRQNGIDMRYTPVKK